MAKTITLELTRTQLKIISAALLSTTETSTLPKRVIRAAEETQDVAPVAEGSEEMAAIEQVIFDAYGALWAYGEVRA